MSPPMQLSSYWEGLGVMIMKDEVFEVKGCGVMSGKMRRKDIQKYKPLGL